MKPLHLYCLTGGGEPAMDGLARDVRHLTHGKVGIVIGPSPGVDYQALPKEALVRFLAAHQAVIEGVMQTAETVVPVRFGTEVASEGEALEILQKGQITIRALLEEMAGRMQLELVVLWEDLNKVLQEIGEDESIRGMKAAYVPGSADSLATKVQIGKQVKTLLDKRRASCAEEILAAVKSVAEDSCGHAPMDDQMVLNVAFLLKREKREAFERRIEEVDRRFEDRLRFRIVGPLPPYSFSTVEVVRPDFAAIERARKALNLPESAALAEIKAANRRLTRRHHPDKTGADGEDKRRFEEISAAYQLLSDYCQNHRYSFREADVRRDIRIQTVSYQSEADMGVWADQAA